MTQTLAVAPDPKLCFHQLTSLTGSLTKLAPGIVVGQGAKTRLYRSQAPHTLALLGLYLVLHFLLNCQLYFVNLFLFSPRLG